LIIYAARIIKSQTEGNRKKSHRNDIKMPSTEYTNDKLLMLWHQINVKFNAVKVIFIFMGEIRSEQGLFCVIMCGILLPSIDYSF
jgi:hypothetical protein